MVRCSASSAAVAINVAPLDVSLRMRAIALLNTVQCNGQPAFEKSFLIGIGTPLPLWIQWGISWASATTGVKYYQENSAIGREHLSQYNEDFGVTTNGISADSYELMDDAALLPATALAVVPGTSFCLSAVRLFSYILVRYLQVSTCRSCGALRSFWILKRWRLFT